MSRETIQKTSLVLMPRLEMYYRTERQINWQIKNCAAEHQHRWPQASILIQDMIADTERFVKEAMELGEYRGKRVLPE